MVYIPEKGERVRVLEVSEKDPYPQDKVGDVVEVGESGNACCPDDFVWIMAVGKSMGTWCKVEPVTEEPTAADAIRAFPPALVGVRVTDGRERLDIVPPPPFMSTDSATRKLMPVATGFLAYFPDAVLLQSWVSRAAGAKHTPGQPMHWDKSKSADEPDAEVRHMLDGFRGMPPDPGLEPLAHLGHLASKAWRANAELQRACDEARAAYERGEEWRK